MWLAKGHLMPDNTLFDGVLFKFHFRSALGSLSIVIILCKAGTRTRQKNSRHVICCYFSSTLHFMWIKQFLKSSSAKLRALKIPWMKNFRAGLSCACRLYPDWSWSMVHTCCLSKGLGELWDRPLLGWVPAHSLNTLRASLVCRILQRSRHHYDTQTWWSRFQGC